MEEASQIDVVYSLERPKDPDASSIFLAGPTFRAKDGELQTGGWRDEALKILKETEFKDTLYVPEFRDGERSKNWTYSRQVDWEVEALEAATVIVFWIPRDLEVLSAFTTNIEFGEYLRSNKIVVGAPTDAPKTRYIFERCSRLKIPTAHFLTVCLENAQNKIKQLRGDLVPVLFTADTHFGHLRTLELSRRPFVSMLEMNSIMVGNWNAVAGKNGIIYHLGDFGAPEFLQYLKGQTIFFLPGNYDDANTLEAITKDPRVKIIKSGHSVNIGESYFNLVHAPEEGTDVNFFYLFGHIHKLQMVKMNGLNVGVDCHHFAPIGEDEVMFYRSAIMYHYDDNVFMLGMGMT